MVNFIKKNCIFIIFSVVELFLGILLIFSRFNNDIKIQVNFIHYCFILLNFFMSLILAIKYKHKFNVYAMLGFMFCVFADYGLVILGKNVTLSVLFFTYAQIAFMLMIGINKKQIFIRTISIVAMELIALLVCKKLYSILVFITIIYIVTFACNIIFAIKRHENKIFIIGMILFILCDICVGLTNFSLFEGLAILNIASNMIFYFYLPGLYLMIFGILLKDLN